MPSQPIPFDAGQASGLEELSGAQPFAVNMLVDAGGALYTRPGLAEWDEWSCPTLDDSGAGAVIGAAVWPSVSGEFLVYVTEDRRLWAMIGPNDRIALSDATATTQLDGEDRPTFAVGKARIYIAGGGLIQKWEGTGLSARLGGSPPVASHVAANSTRLVASAPTIGGFEFWSNPGETPGHETWDTGLDFAEAEARPDRILATHENSNEVFAFGETTLQLFIPDPSAGYVTGRSSNIGLAAPYSVIRVGEAFYLLASDEGRVLAKTNGRDLVPLSEPYMTKTLDRFETVDDCWGFRARTDSWDLAVWVFPSEGRTLVYDSSSKQWSEWKSAEDGVEVPWVGTAHVRWTSRNLHLIGMPDGTMALLDPETFQDVGEALIGRVRTGSIDRGSKNEKECERIALTMRRGEAETEAPEVSIRWREGLGTFSQPVKFSLGLNGDSAATVAKWGLGMYRDRQYELEFSANASFVLARAMETYVEVEA